MCYFVCGCQWCHSVVLCQGRAPRCHYHHFLRLSPNTSAAVMHAYVWGCEGVLEEVQYVHECSYACVHVRLQPLCAVGPGERRDPRHCCGQLEVSLKSKPWNCTAVTDGPHFPFLALSLSVILHCDDGCPALCKYSPAPASKHGWHDPRWWSQAKFTSKINTSRVSAVMLSRRTVAIVQQEKEKKKKKKHVSDGFRNQRWVELFCIWEQRTDWTDSASRAQWRETLYLCHRL